MEKGMNEYLEVLGVSLMNIMLGSLVGAILGCAVALLTSVIRELGAVVGGICRVTQLVPGVCLILLISFGGGDRADFTFCIIAAFVGMFAAAYRDLRNTNKEILEMAKVFRMPADNMVRYIYLPGIKRTVRQVLVMGVSTCFAWGVTAEALCNISGTLGGRMFEAFSGSDRKELILWTVITVLMALVLRGVFVGVVSLMDKFTSKG